ncbi:MAG TPA: universal stress protein [Thermomicrobiales bacterium]
MTDAEHPVILVPLDGSPEAERALPLAENLAGSDGRLILLRVVRASDALPERWPPVEVPERDLRAEAEEHVRRETGEVAERVRPAVPGVEVVTAVGDPAEEIIRLAEEEQVDLIVMTTRGRSLPGRLLFGSVADRVARHSTRPTLIVRVDVPPTPLARIIVPLDGSPLSEEALPVAVRVAKRRNLPIHLVRIVEVEEIVDEIRRNLLGDLYTMPRDDAYALARSRREAAAADYLAKRAEQVRAEGIEADVEVKSGTPAFELLDLARPSDLVVITSHGRGGVQRWLIGSVAEKLVREADAPVLIVPAPKERADSASREK